MRFRSMSESPNDQTTPSTARASAQRHEIQARELCESGNERLGIARQTDTDCIRLSLVATRAKERNEISNAHRTRDDDRNGIRKVCKLLDKSAGQVRNDDSLRHDPPGRLQMLRLEVPDLVGHDPVDFTPAEVL